MPFLLALLFLCLTLAAGAREPLKLPYREAGLTPRQAALHLLNRLAYGPRPGQVDQVVEMGLEAWVEQQLTNGGSDAALEERLQVTPGWFLDNAQLRERYPNYNIIQDRAAEAGLKKLEGTPTDAERKTYNEALNRFAADNGYKFVRELFDETFAHKLLSAVYADNQLREVLTDFWFNHFNVANVGEDPRRWLVSYERDALRPFVLGRFQSMLEATAQHPAMLTYLNNNLSSANKNSPTTLNAQMDSLEAEQAGQYKGKQPVKRGSGGLNENYARELMELHTLGVDGGYSQADVVDVARALTGWTVYPRAPNQAKLREQVAAGALGYVQEGDFLFRADQHDARAKIVLGRQFPGGGGVEEGRQILSMLAHHPSTARNVSRKLAARFVSDNPPAALVDRLAFKYLSTNGDLQALLQTIVESPEFWAPEARAAKLKSPFELAASCLRAADADVTSCQTVYGWLTRMGEPVYSCLVPTGFPDRAQAWLNSGTLLNRMNFALLVGQGRMNGVTVPLKAYAAETPAETLRRVAAQLLPQDPTGQVLVRLEKQLQEPGDGYVARKTPLWFNRPQPADLPQRQAQARTARAVGVVLGSPEFQRR